MQSDLLRVLQNFFLVLGLVSCHPSSPQQAPPSSSSVPQNPPPDLPIPASSGPLGDKLAVVPPESEDFSLSTLAQIQGSYAPIKNRACLEAYAKGPDLQRHQQSAIAYYNGQQMTEADARTVLQYRDPVNIAMSLSFDHRLLQAVKHKLFSRTFTGAQIGSAYRLGLLTQKDNRPFAALPRTVSVYARTFLWPIPGNETGKKPIACLSIPAPALDTSSQPHYAYYMEGGVFQEARYREEMHYLAKMVVKVFEDRCLQKKECERLLISGYGTGCFLAALSSEDSEKARTIFGDSLNPAIQALLDQYPPNQQKAIAQKIKLSVYGSATYPTSSRETLFGKYGVSRENLFVKGDILKVAQPGDLIVNAWDPHSLPGNGNDADGSLDGYLGRGTGIVLTQSPWLNPFLLEPGSKRYVDASVF